MDSMVTELLGGIEPGGAHLVAPLQFIYVLLASTALNIVIAKAYSLTHGGYSYSKNFLQAIVMVGIIVSLIMVIIGSDIARAFALVGAMSIVRFRTPIKDSRDLVFIFAAIAVGMACGVQFFVQAAIFTAAMVVLVLAFHYWNFGELSDNGFVMKIQVSNGQREKLAQLMSSMCKRASIVSVSRRNASDDLEDVIYEVELKRGVHYKELIDNLSTTVSPQSVNLLVGESNVNA